MNITYIYLHTTYIPIYTYVVHIWINWQTIRAEYMYIERNVATPLSSYLREYKKLQNTLNNKHFLSS